LRSQGEPVEIATYDGRLAAAAQQMGFVIADL
jgi:hypothetical protein